MLYFVNDHNGTVLKNFLLQKCVQNNILAIDIYPNSTAGDDYPIIAKLLVEKLKPNAIKFQETILNSDLEEKSFVQDLGVAICGSGQGMCMALNKFDWIRAGITNDNKVGTQIRQHNYANCLCLGAWESVYCCC